MTLFSSSSSFFVHLLLLINVLRPSSAKLNHLFNANETDRLALLDFKDKITSDPLGIMASWNHSLHFCQWTGVTCGRRHQRVTVLDLNSHNLAGPISPHIGNLSFLKRLVLANNSFSSKIPQELGRLRRIQYMLLSTNSLTGDIPANISNCIKLVQISLSNNQLSGTIPMEITSLVNLRVLSMNNNNLAGNVPSSIGNLSSLQVLSAVTNHFSGRIPDSLGQLKDLTWLALGDNKLVGIIPPSIFNLSSLNVLNFGMNQLNGTLPKESSIFSLNLKTFGIFDNQFSGSLPPSLSNATNLQILLVTINKFTGPVPNLENFHELQTLNIAENNLGYAEEGDLRFLSTLTNATSLNVLSIAFNNFGGVLPDSVINLSLSKLRIFAFDANQIVGTLPSAIDNLKSLQIFTAWSNHLSGSIPESISKLQMLQLLDLGNNELTGNIPSSIGNLDKLNKLSLAGNKLHGSIPASLGKCQKLVYLDISDNSLNGSIPLDVFTISSLSMLLNLSQNQFTGPIPMEIGNLKALSKLDVSQNMLSGAIPGSLGSCETLEWLGMQENSFYGTIPSSFSSLRGLQYLNLSHNNLSGEIPKYLESFRFENLDMSFNSFSGLLPSGGIFKNASATSVEGNNMLCGSTPEFHLPICKFGEPKKKRKALKVKIMIPIIVSSLAAILVIASLIFLLLRKKRNVTATPLSENLMLQISYQTLQKATGGFSSTNLVGAGGFGSVYKGILDPQGNIVAVKVFNLQQRGAFKSFMVECEALRNIRHRNLVKVITACSSIDFHGDDFKAIVYEFMVNGSLDQWLHPTPELENTRGSTRKLNLLQRLNIAIDVACALDYLRNGYGRTPIAHCDLKPSNVLLDDEMTAQVGDFGLMKFLSSEGANNLSTNLSSVGVRGTIGYAAPEYGMGSEASTYGDMYSFGILLLEIFTGKKPTDGMLIDNMNLHNYVKVALPEQVAEITEPTLVEVTEEDENSSERNHMVMESLILIFRIGIACSEETPKERMNISDALAKLTVIRDKLFANQVVSGQNTDHQQAPRRGSLQAS